MDAADRHNNFTEVNTPVFVEGDASEAVAELPAVTQSMADLLPQHRKETSPKWMKARKIAGRVALAAVCTVPVADLALSDAASLKVLQVTQDLVHVDSPNVDRAVQDGIVGLDILLESMLVGGAITRSKKLKGAFNDMEEYTEKRRAAMSTPRRVVSDVVNSPYNALGYISEKFEKLGEKVASCKLRAARVLGGLAVDAGKVNAIGTSGVILQETLAGNPPDLKRNARLASLIAVTWVGTAEAIRELYRHVPAVQPPLEAIGKAFATVTTPDNPLSISVLSAVGIGLANSGWHIAKFHEAKANSQNESGLPGTEQ